MASSRGCWTGWAGVRPRDLFDVIPGRWGSPVDLVRCADSWYHGPSRCGRVERRPPSRTGSPNPAPQGFDGACQPSALKGTANGPERSKSRIRGGCGEVSLWGWMSSAQSGAWTIVSRVPRRTSRTLRSGSSRHPGWLTLHTRRCDHHAVRVDSEPEPVVTLGLPVRLGTDGRGVPPGQRVQRVRDQQQAVERRGGGPVGDELRRVPKSIRWAAVGKGSTAPVTGIARYRCHRPAWVPRIPGPVRPWSRPTRHIRCGRSTRRPRGMGACWPGPAASPVRPGGCAAARYRTPPT